MSGAEAAPAAGPGGAAGAAPSPDDERAAMLREVAEGLARPQKELSPKYFYDTRGSELFERITRLPEYYLTRAERALLERWAPTWFERIRPAAIVELGAGSARKTRILLDAMRGVGSGDLFVPLDVSGEFLLETASRLREEYPRLQVEPEVADITAPLELSVELPSPALFALLGSTIGNFPPAGAARLLRHVRGTMQPGDVFLMGTDLRPGPGKSVEALEAAYDDSEGVTAEFNLNMLRVLNAELGADFDPGGFEHRAFYDGTEGRIEMHLESVREQVVHLPGVGAFAFAPGETVRTEISCKYDRDAVAVLFEEAGLALEEWRADDAGRFAIALGGVA